MHTYFESQKVLLCVAFKFNEHTASFNILDLIYCHGKYMGETKDDSRGARRFTARGLSRLTNADAWEVVVVNHKGVKTTVANANLNKLIITLNCTWYQIPGCKYLKR